VALTGKGNEEAMARGIMKTVSGDVWYINKGIGMETSIYLADPLRQ